ncbi:DEAD/DEAH box helicase family protein [Fulvimarina sp. MAC3]|uniref:BPTD_3080 family restriction endonuclease n=1 Tax=Fulvimarina sp. MAC3 TaxID=3148887 RepID=UPI0031FCFC82
MATPFYEQPILNSPYHFPTRHHCLDDRGQPTALDPLPGRRRSKYLTPVPTAKRRRADQAELAFHTQEGEPGTYSENPIVNEIRTHLSAWRSLPNPADWSVSPTTQRLLLHWRQYAFEGPRPFFCQLEAVETAIWLSEVAPKNSKRYASLFSYLETANLNANPELMRLALKLATGAGKTTVMAMLIAWQTLNAVRSPSSKRFSKSFLIVTPGITIRDRLRVLLPADGENYYRTRELVPAEMLTDLGKAKIVLTNYHAFQLRKTSPLNQVGQAAMRGWREEAIEIEESEEAMLERACGDLLRLGRPVVVLNDEAHHCYREKPEDETVEETKVSADEREEVKQNKEAARLWISGLEALNRKIGVKTVYDLSATPFFLRGSGYAEGTLFPWVVSDFSLVDAIECGIVKLPRVPVSDNTVANDLPIFRNLWDHIGKAMPKKGAAKSGDLSPEDLPDLLKNALLSLYSHYEDTDAIWRKAGIDVPPVFIVVCNNTATSKLVYEWISGYEREIEGVPTLQRNGHLEMFRNYDEYGNPLPRMNTLLIDSEQLESGEALDSNFRKLAETEIEQFRRELRERQGSEAGTLSDADLLREVMNTVGRKGRLGADIRCVVSVSMLTEGWDANTVTHVLGVRAFGTQLLCEQVIGRGLRRQSYELGEQITPEGHPLFDVEYADILGIPFDFATEGRRTAPTPPKKLTHIRALKERAACAIRFPRVAGYRTELPDDRFSYEFDKDSALTVTTDNIGPGTTRMEGVVGEGYDLTADVLDETRPAAITFHLTKRLIERYFWPEGAAQPSYNLVPRLQPVVRRWQRDHLVLTGELKPAVMVYFSVQEMAVERIYQALVRGAAKADGNGSDRQVIRAILDPYNPSGVTDHVGFSTSKDRLWATAQDKCHVNFVVGDSDWELEAARVIESHPATIAYVKNQGLGFEIPYRSGSIARRYVPDFIVQIDDGNGPDDPLHLICETKGYRGEDAKDKKTTTETFWLPGVNRMGTYGRWAFREFRDIADFQRLWDEAASEFIATKSIHLQDA